MYKHFVLNGFHIITDILFESSKKTKKHPPFLHLKKVMSMVVTLYVCSVSFVSIHKMLWKKRKENIYVLFPFFLINGTVLVGAGFLLTKQALKLF